MIRVAILADSTSRRSELTEILAEDERIEVLEMRPLHRIIGEGSPVDVFVAAGTSDELPAGIPTVVLTQDAELSGGDASIRAVLPLNASAAEIVAAIVAAAADLTVLTQAQVRHLLRGRQTTEHGILVEPLTPRESQVLRMLADGLGNKEIAARLGISDHTAKFHVTQILGKLGAGSRTEAVAIGIRRGMVPI